MKNRQIARISIQSVAVLGTLILSPIERSNAEVDQDFPVTVVEKKAVSLKNVVTVKGTIRPHASTVSAFKNFTGQVRSSGQGGVSEGDVVTVNPNVSLVLYRAYSARFDNGLGHWWTPSFQYTGPLRLSAAITTNLDTRSISYSSSPVIESSMTVDQYRTENAICKNWNDLDRVIICNTKTGATLLIGKTQSVNAGQCEDPSVKNSEVILYPARDTLQIFIEPADIDESSCQNYALKWEKR